MENNKSRISEEKELNLKKNIDKLNKQIENNFKKAFFDLLSEKIKQEPPDYEWIEKLYKELRDKLCNILKNNSILRNEIEESMDLILFSQMIRNNAFDGLELYKQIVYIFDKFKQLGSAARDKEVDIKKDEIIEMMKKNCTFYEIVPVFFKNSYYCLENIYTDLENFSKSLQKYKK
tara:strand:- start:225 stop:752 length:528 start_codon:yes stop_codon:yes gene_type:complete